MCDEQNEGGNNDSTDGFFEEKNVDNEEKKMSLIIPPVNISDQKKLVQKNTNEKLEIKKKENIKKMRKYSEKSQTFVSAVCPDIPSYTSYLISLVLSIISYIPFQKKLQQPNEKSLLGAPPTLHVSDRDSIVINPESKPPVCADECLYPSFNSSLSSPSEISFLSNFNIRSVQIVASPLSCSSPSSDLPSLFPFHPRDSFLPGDRPSPPLTAVAPLSDRSSTFCLDNNTLPISPSFQFNSRYSSPAEVQYFYGNVHQRGLDGKTGSASSIKSPSDSVEDRAEESEGLSTIPFNSLLAPMVFLFVHFLLCWGNS
jgi:hypothetical protein